jgi:hypothetical protein
MKTTLDIPDALFHLAKSAAAEQGIPFRKLVSDALAEELRVRAPKDKPWLKTFGQLRSLRKESASINRTGIRPDRTSALAVNVDFVPGLTRLSW